MNQTNQNIHKIDFTGGLSLEEISIIAVLNNPDLKAIRSQLMIAQAQVFSAGLLPDPQFSLSIDKPTGNITAHLELPFLNNHRFNEITPYYTAMAQSHIKTAVKQINGYTVLKVPSLIIN